LYEIFYGAGAEEQDRISSAGQNSSEFNLGRIERANSAIGDDFGDFSAERSQGVGQIAARAITARQKNGLLVDGISELFGERESAVGVRLVGYREAGGLRSGGCGGADCGHVLRRRGGERKFEYLHTSGDCVDGVFAGKQQPIESGKLPKVVVERGPVSGFGKFDQGDRRDVRPALRQ